MFDMGDLLETHRKLAGALQPHRRRTRHRVMARISR
jgi:hypothetical protein